MIKVISITYSNNNRKDRLTSLEIFTTVGRRQLRHLSFNHMDRPLPLLLETRVHKQITRSAIVGGTTSKRACATAPCPVAREQGKHGGDERGCISSSPGLRQNWLAPKRRRSSRCYETRMSGAESGSAYGSFNRCARFLDRSYTLALFAPLPSQYAYRKSPRPDHSITCSTRVVYYGHGEKREADLVCCGGA